MRVTMKYGRSGLVLDLPDEWEVTLVEKRPMPVLPDPEAAVRRALSEPVGSKPLAEEARGARSACVLICDITRPVPNSSILPTLIRDLLDAGVEQGRVTLLVATGLHRPNEGDELRELVGHDGVLRSVRVVNHRAESDADHVFLGTTERGIPVKLDRRLVEADVRVAVGLVEPHPMAGYSGGRKVVVPGAAHRDTIASLHAARLMETPGVGNCVLDGNPLHRELLEIVRMLDRALAVNTVIDDQRRLSYISFGDVVESHLDAVSYARTFLEIPVPRRFGTILTSAAGYPLDATYHQSTKGILAPVDVFEPGGDMVLVAECAQGFGSASFAAAQQRMIRLGREGFLRELRAKDMADTDEWVTELLLRPLGMGTVHMYTQGLSAEETSWTGVRVVDSPLEALRKSVSRRGDRRVMVIPEGPYAIPVYTP